MQADMRATEEELRARVEQLKKVEQQAEIRQLQQNLSSIQVSTCSSSSSSWKQLKHLSSRLTGAVDQWQQMGKEKRDSAAVQQREQKAYEEYERFRKEIKRAKAAYKKAFFDNMDREKLMLPDATNLNQLLTTIERSTILQGNEKKREQLAEKEEREKKLGIELAGLEEETRRRDAEHAAITQQVQALQSQLQAEKVDHRDEVARLREDVEISQSMLHERIEHDQKLLASLRFEISELSEQLRRKDALIKDLSNHIAVLEDLLSGAAR
ncbi:hypothetical protein GUITHDRAFT_101810 [Guillardia theta CCMP2712]|uniref:Uncharacterized protein n=1 Tax=Guillardia theta (strain CCMP2712) TaxID=905079 RepID=L1JX14_GUITC|nr:hypothetical protein GUITHDRAFT_101810 [Guillardia theta CCMP2712]EKX52648.1 hypothetical protein GUITHDRAFT_101810 [Guillardia theta CCMP2712]|eukprot:XP_005839628.1 hypothetical protein GUITHDRAFT_101810 [Guillardia theta CCMP2712]